MIMTTLHDRPRPSDPVPFIGGPLDGQLAESFRPTYRSAETGQRVSTRASWPTTRGNEGGMLPQRTRRQAARVYIRVPERGGYVWMPTVLGIDMSAPWVQYVDGPMFLGQWWASGHVKYRD